MDKNEAQFVGSIPDFYDRGLGPVIFADFAADMARRVAATNPGRVLETAAGTGIVSRALRDHLPAATELIATDLNAPMLDVARTKFQPSEKITFQTADAQALSFADDSFDAMVCQFGIMFYPDKPKGYREAFRVLKRGGRYFFSVWDSHKYNPFGRIGDDLARQLFPADPPGFYRVPYSSHQIDPIKEALLDTGFTDLTIDVIRLEKTIPDLSLFAQGMVFGNPLIDQIRARGTTSPETVHAKLLEAFGREFGTNPAVMPIQTVTFSALKPA
jgi:SAM-dependent methyltransferase